jgi:hypothetical protein
MVFNATFNNISILLMEETGVPRENHRPASHWKPLSHNAVSSTTLVVISTNCTLNIITLTLSTNKYCILARMTKNDGSHQL